MAPQTRCGAASIVSSSTIADIVVPFCFYVAVRLYLTYRLSIQEKGNGVKGVPPLARTLGPGHPQGDAYSHQLKDQSTRPLSSNWAELGCFLRLFMWQPDCMRRSMSPKAVRRERSPAKASIKVLAQSRTTWASLTRLR